MDPRATEAEVLYLDRSVRPATVLGWKRLDVARRQPITERWIFWLVHLQLPGGRKAGSSTTASTCAPDTDHDGGSVIFTDRVRRQALEFRTRGLRVRCSAYPHVHGRSLAQVTGLRRPP